MHAVPSAFGIIDGGHSHSTAAIVDRASGGHAKHALALEAREYVDKGHASQKGGVAVATHPPVHSAALRHGSGSSSVDGRATTATRKASSHPIP